MTTYPVFLRCPESDDCKWQTAYRQDDHEAMGALLYQHLAVSHRGVVETDPLKAGRLYTKPVYMRYAR